MLAELGVLILLFAIGLETDLARLVRVGATSMTVAVVGVVLPFVLGYVACRLLGQSDLRSIMAAATLTATSVGITARVLSDLGHLHSAEGQIILGAALIDDVLGLLLLTIIEGLSQGQAISPGLVVGSAARAFGFLIVAAAASAWGAPVLKRLTGRVESPASLTVLAVIFALAMAWLARAVRVGDDHRCLRGGPDFVADARAARGRARDHGARALLRPDLLRLGRCCGRCGCPESGRCRRPVALGIGVILIVLGIVGKLLAGYAPFWFRGNRTVIGVGMIPRGEVGLIFARIGLAAGVFDAGLFGAATLMVIVTTLAAPPALKRLLPRSGEDVGVEPDEESIHELVVGS